MHLLGHLLARALAAVGVTELFPHTTVTPVFRGPTPQRRSRKNRVPYGLGLLEFQRRRNKEHIAKTDARPRDPHGAFTLVGRNPRRMWLAGISAQRGY